MKLFAVLWVLVWLGDTVFVNFFSGVAVFKAPSDCLRQGTEGVVVHYCQKNKYPILPPSAIHNPLWQSSFFTCKAIRVSISKDVWLTHSPWLLTLTRFHSVGTRLELLPIYPLTCMVFFGFTLLLSLVNMWCYIVGLLIRISNKKSRETLSGGYFRNFPLLLYFLHSWTQSITKYILLFFIFGIFNWRIYFATTCTKLSF